MTTCKVCSDPLVVYLEAEDSGPTVPDDLLLTCGCHFHWQCLLDQSPQLATSLNCPACNSYLPSNSAAASSSSSTAAAPPYGAAILTRYVNEGGVQEGLDILPTVMEEAYLAEHPEARPAQALHLMCAEGDIGGIVELLEDVHTGGDEDEDEDNANRMDVAQLLRYQSPLNGMRSGLHLAVEKGQEEVFWLLLWLASGLPQAIFPEAVAQTALGMGLSKGELAPGQEDIRFLKDGQGKTAGDLCSEAGGQWQRFVEGGLFSS